MSSVKYQIFVSSTYEDLKTERDQVVKAILEMGHIPVGMEMFSAADEDQWSIIAANIRNCDYYVVIIAHRYGSRDATGKSFTEKEYDYAVAQGLPILAFVISDGASWPGDRIDRDSDALVALESFKNKARSKYVGFWSSFDDLYGKVSVALMKQMSARPRTGWLRADQAMSPEVAGELARLSRENSELRARLESALEAARVAAITPRDAWRRFFVTLGKFVDVPVHSTDQEYARITAIREALEQVRADTEGTRSAAWIPQAEELVEVLAKNSGGGGVKQLFARFRQHVSNDLAEHPAA